MHFPLRWMAVLALVVSVAPWPGVWAQSAPKPVAKASGKSGAPAAPPTRATPAAQSAGVNPSPGQGSSGHDSISAGDRIVPPQAGYRFRNGQVLTYTAEWHLFTAGTGVIRLDAEGPLQRVTATAESTGVVNLLFGVHDRFQATFDPKSFCSLSVFKHSEEGLHRRETQIHFEYSRRKSVLEEKNLKTGEQKRVENDIQNCNTDVISGIFYVSALPLNDGLTYTFPVADGGKVTTAVARVDGKETVKTPGGTFHTIRVLAEGKDEPLKSKGKLTIWYTDDAAHIPVQMQAKLGWGSLLFRLQAVEKGK